MDEFDDLIKDAFQLYSQRKYEEALAKCVKAVELRPSDFRPHYISGAVYMAQWKMKSASEAFAKAIFLNPKEKSLHVNKSRADRHRNEREEAVAAAREAIKLDAAYAEAYVALADALSIGAKDYSEIIEAYRTAIKLKPTLFNAYKDLGMFLSVSKDKKGAEEVYRNVMDLDPNKMIGRFELGRLLVEQGRLKEAREVWDGRKSDKDNTFPNFITLLERAEKKKKAEDALAKKPNDPEALLQMGLMVMDGESWVVDGRQEKAIVYFRKALEKKPDFAQAQYAICKAYVQMADTFKSKNKETDEEIAKLRKMDAKLADEITQYRKTYSGGLRTGPPPPKDQ
ncbi:MAG TPA: hypothetical protein PLN05_09855 [Pyrinomonadaceae bacterium]|nr:hypothetical protein [Chloracidobacterium sp.]HRJ90251.1 hypothetical protein [Pyrinomonadaceae bacterium]HRK50720.1 hypothetical protein [Pyrinomonadaceae bacterium]